MMREVEPGVWIDGTEPKMDAPGRAARIDWSQRLRDALVLLCLLSVIVLVIVEAS